MSQKQNLKAYLVTTDEVLIPFGKLGAQLNLGHETLQDRLTRQFAAHGISLQVVSDKSTLGTGENRILVTDRTVVSDRALSIFLGFCSQQNQGLQLEVNTRHDEAITFDEASERILAIDCFYFPAGQTTTQKIQIAREDVHQVSTGMPDSVYQVSNARVVFPLVFALNILSWVDYLKAASLICREYTSQSVAQSSRWLPQKLVKYFVESPRLSKYFNKIGQNCKIHPTAILEGCVIGDGVEIGPYTYLRGSVVGSGTSIREHSSIKASMIGKNSFIMPCDLFNAFVGNETVIFTSIFHNSIIGDRSFIGGGTGFSDLNAAQTTILAQNEKTTSDSQARFLGSAIGNDCFLGAGLIFKSGQIIPSGTQILNPTMIHSIPHAENQLYVANQGKLLKIPKNFIDRGPK